MKTIALCAIAVAAVAIVAVIVILFLRKDGAAEQPFSAASNVPEATQEATAKPTAKPTAEPTAEPTMAPIVVTTQAPTPTPTPTPIPTPTPPPKLSEADIADCNPAVTKPSSYAYLAEREVRTIRSAGGYGVYLRSKPNNIQDYWMYTIRDGHTVTVFARENGYSFVLADDGGWGWITSEFLV